MEKLVIKSLVKDVIPVTEKESPHRFVIKLEDDSELKARIVIIAIGNTSIPNVPPVFRPLYEKGLVKHIFKPFQNEKCMNKRILVIGGGLSAAQLAIKACAMPHCTVVLCARNPLRKRQFDIPLEWVGRARGRLLSQFYNLSNLQRLDAIKQIRGGGSIPSEYIDQLEAFQKEGVLVVHEGANVTDLSFSDQYHATLTFSDSACQMESFDHLWLATGSEMDVRKIDMFQSLRKICPCQLLDEKIPILTEGMFSCF